jgi:hypothetical protein
MIHAMHIWKCKLGDQFFADAQNDKCGWFVATYFWQHLVGDQFFAALRMTGVAGALRLTFGNIWWVINASLTLSMTVGFGSFFTPVHGRGKIRY